MNLKPGMLLVPEDPDTMNATNILECLWIDCWNSPSIHPRIDGRTIFNWYENAINHLLDKGSIRWVEKVDYNA